MHGSRKCRYYLFWQIVFKQTWIWILKNLAGNLRICKRCTHEIHSCKLGFISPISLLTFLTPCEFSLTRTELDLLLLNLAWCKSGTRTPGPGTPLKFKSGTPGPPSKFKSGIPAPPTKFKSGTFIIIFRHCWTYFGLHKYIYIYICLYI